MLRRMVALLCIAVLAAGCSDDGGDLADPPDADEVTTITTGVVRLPEPEPDSLDGLIVSDENIVATTQSEEDVFIVDGLGGQNGGDPALRAWIAPIDDPTSARSIDLSDYGPRHRVSVTWWNGEFYISSLACPKPNLDHELEDPTTVELCGSTTWDLFAYDPATNATRPVLPEAALGDRGWLYVHDLSTTDFVKISHSDFDPEALMTADGEIEPLPQPPEAKQLGHCTIGGSIYAFSTPYTESREMRPLNDFMTAYRFVDGAWEGVALPDTPTMTTRVSRAGCMDDGYIVSTLESPAGETGVQADIGAETLGVSADGDLTWTPIPIDDLPPNFSAVPRIEVISGIVTAEIQLEERVPFGDETPATTLLAWIGGEWVTVSDTVETWPMGITGNVQTPAMLVRDDTAILALDLPDTAGPPPVFHVYD